jgi:hypothetical protein
VYVCTLKTIKVDALDRQMGQYAYLDHDASVTELGSGLHDHRSSEASRVTTLWLAGSQGHPVTKLLPQIES